MRVVSGQLAYTGEQCSGKIAQQHTSHKTNDVKANELQEIQQKTTNAMFILYWHKVSVLYS